MTFPIIVLVFTTTCTALMAGLFFAYSYSVVLGLKALGDVEYIAAMQSINRAILNPVFFLVFFGALISLPVCTYLYYSQPITQRFWLLLAATAVYIVGVFGVTVLGNIPLNNALEKFNLVNASAETISRQRALFEDRWNSLNLIRTIASLLSLVLVIIACIGPGKSVE